MASIKVDTTDVMGSLIDTWFRLCSASFYTAIEPRTPLIIVLISEMFLYKVGTQSSVLIFGCPYFWVSFKRGSIVHSSYFPCSACVCSHISSSL